MIYARQINPEYQESPLFWGDESLPDDIAVFGNKNYHVHMPEVFERVKEVFDNGELVEAIEDIQGKSGFYYDFFKNITAAINDMLYPEKSKYSTRDIHKIKEILLDEYKYTSNNYNNSLCDLMGVVTGKEWDWDTIRGCCQGECQDVFYPVDNWSRESIEAFETEYFNTGSEWIVSDEDIDGDIIPEDIDGYSIYCYSWNDEDIKAEIASAAGCAVDNVKLFKYNGYDYEAV